MAKAMVVTYECEQCGTDVVVTRTGETMLSPIYCCGMEVTEISSVEKKPVKPKKKAVKKVRKRLQRRKSLKGKNRLQKRKHPKSN